jgi:hypothetical protein
MPVDGGEAEATSPPAESAVSSYAWAPDGGWIAYTMADPKPKSRRPGSGRSRDVIVADTEFRFAHLHMVPLRPDAAGKREAVRLTEGDFHVGSFDWSPDGARIVFAHAAGSPDQHEPVGGGHRRGGRDHANRAPPGHRGGVHTGPLFSPDGRTVAFVSTGTGSSPSGWETCTWWTPPVEPRASWPTPRTGAPASWPGPRTDGACSPSPCGPSGTSWPCRWTAERRAWSPGGRGSSAPSPFTGTEPTWPSPSRIPIPLRRTRLAGGGFAMRKVTDVHAGVPRPAMGRSEVLTWRSPDGAFEIDGILTYPVGYQPGQRVPLVLNVHGGPAGVFSRASPGARPSTRSRSSPSRGTPCSGPTPGGAPGTARSSATPTSRTGASVTWMI